MTIQSRIAAAFAVVLLTLVFAGQSHATVFVAWQVASAQGVGNLWFCGQM
ncbi:hypothetical protein [Mesorhizobium sp. SARCC-RB16n]|nr:hypothetical protein [Mesorhizobium sp. SARCC-RB16n]